MGHGYARSKKIKAALALIDYLESGNPGELNTTFRGALTERYLGGLMHSDLAAVTKKVLGESKFNILCSGGNLPCFDSPPDVGCGDEQKNTRP